MLLFKDGYEITGNCYKIGGKEIAYGMRIPSIYRKDQCWSICSSLPDAKGCSFNEPYCSVVYEDVVDDNDLKKQDFNWNWSCFVIN